MVAAEASIAVSTSGRGHAAWVRVCHWLIAAGVVTLAVSGFVILMAHPRLYWGEIGNDLTPALLELPVSHNHRPEGWQIDVTFSELTGAPVSGIRTYDADIFNENAWARSLHFLAAWIVLTVGFLYAALGAVTGQSGATCCRGGAILRRARYGARPRRTCRFASARVAGRRTASYSGAPTRSSRSPCCRSWCSRASRWRQPSQRLIRHCLTCSAVTRPRARCTSSDSAR